MDGHFKLRMLQARSVWCVSHGLKKNLFEIMSPVLVSRISKDEGFLKFLNKKKIRLLPRVIENARYLF